MALIRANVDPFLVRMMGRWKSWTMIRYLHRSALDTADLSSKMLLGGTFVIQKQHKLPVDAAQLLAEAARLMAAASPALHGTISPSHGR